LIGLQVTMMADWRDAAFEEHIPQRFDQRPPVEGLCNRRFFLIEGMRYRDHFKIV
jgi:hypothetical protein